MRLRGSTLQDFTARLRRLDPEALLSRALADSAERLAQAVRDTHPDAPPVTATPHGLRAQIGATHPEATLRERGDVGRPPRPFLAPVAAASGPAIAHDLARAITSALQGEAVEPRPELRRQPE